MRHYGAGYIEARRPGIWRVRYYVGGQRHSVTVNGTRMDAQRKLRELLGAADTGEHIAPSRLTLTAWMKHWLLLLGRGEANGVRRRGLVSPRTRERYEELLQGYVLPSLGDRLIQKLTPTEIDRLYIALEQRVSVTTVRHVHVALRSCLATAVRKGHLAKNPCDAADPPRPVEPDVGQVLNTDDVRRLIAGFTGSVYLPIVQTAIATGLRLSELLALRWADIDWAAKTLQVERAIERTKEFGRVLKEPKSWRSKRTIVIDAALIAVLQAEQQKHLRLRAGVPDGANVSLAAIKLPAKALVFPAPPVAGTFDFTRLRNPNTVTRETRERFRKLGFERLRFHDLRGSHATALLDAGIPVHVVAERLGHDPAVLLRSYARRSRKADDATATVLAQLAQAYSTQDSP